jgi:large subunit ribosomal protein L29
MSKTAKAKELREQSTDQLVASLADVQNQLFRLRIQRQTERLEAPSEIIKARREIARLKTIIGERESSAS